VFTGRFVVVQCKLSGGGRGGRTGEFSVGDLGNVLDIGEQRLRRGSPCVALFEELWEDFRSTRLRGGWLISGWYETGNVISWSTTEQVLLASLSWLLAFRTKAEATWDEIGSSDWERALWLDNCWGADASKILTVGIYDAPLGTKTACLFVDASCFSFAAPLPLFLFPKKNATDFMKDNRRGASKIGRSGG